MKKIILLILLFVKIGANAQLGNGNEVKTSTQFGLKPLRCFVRDSTQEFILDPRDFIYANEFNTYFSVKIEIYDSTNKLIFSPKHFNYVKGENAHWSIPYGYLPLKDGKHSLYAVCNLYTNIDKKIGYSFQSFKPIYINKVNILTLECNEKYNLLSLKLNFPEYPSLKQYDDEKSSDFSKIIENWNSYIKVTLVSAIDNQVLYQNDFGNYLNKIDISKMDVNLIDGEIFAILEYYFEYNKGTVTLVKSQPITINSKLNVTWRLDTIKEKNYSNLVIELSGGTYSRKKWNSFTYFTNVNNEIINGNADKEIERYKKQTWFWGKFELESLILPTGKNLITPHVVMKSDYNNVIRIDLPTITFQKKHQVKYWRLIRYRITNPQTSDVEVPIFSRNQDVPDYYKLLNGKITQKKEVAKLVLDNEQKIDFTINDEDVLFNDYEGSAKCKNCLSLLDSSEEITMNIMNKTTLVGDVQASIKSPELFRTKEIKVINEMRNDTIGFVDVKWSILQSNLDSIKFQIRDRHNHELLPFWMNNRNFDSLMIKEPKGVVDILFKVPYWYLVKEGDFMLNAIGYKNGALPVSDNLLLPGIILNKELKLPMEAIKKTALKFNVLPIVRREGVFTLPITISITNSFNRNLFIEKAKLLTKLKLTNFKSDDRVNYEEKRLVKMDTTIYFEGDSTIVYFPLLETKFPSNTPLSEGGLCFLETESYLQLDSMHKVQIEGSKTKEFSLHPMEYRNLEIAFNHLTLKRKLPKNESKVLFKLFINGKEEISLHLLMDERKSFKDMRHLKRLYFSVLPDDKVEIQVSSETGKVLCDIPLDISDGNFIKNVKLTNKKQIKEFEWTLYSNPKLRW